MVHPLCLTTSIYIIWNTKLNLVPISDFWIPCNITPSMINTWAIYHVCWETFMGMKWYTLFKRSTTTKMKSLVQEFICNMVMKSIVISSHFHLGMLKGCDFPFGCLSSILILSQSLYCIYFYEARQKISLFYAHTIL